MTLYNSVLNEYFAQRETLYTAVTSDFDLERFESIQEWKDRLNITVQSANITPFVVDVISETATEVKLCVYEWVWIDYVCNGYETIDSMGFEIDHIIRLNKQENSVQLSTDSYFDSVNGFECGTAEDLAIFELEIADLKPQ